MPDETDLHSASMSSSISSAWRQLVSGRSILVCVTGGIAAYKSATLVSGLAQAGAKVWVAMTPSATRFITPLTLQSLSGHPVFTSAWEHVDSLDPQHISLAGRVDAAVVAPCTMECLAALAHGRGDNIVSLLISSIDRANTPVLLAPAMNKVMWEQPATQRNLTHLAADGFSFVGPVEGWQACRTVGDGRMSEPLKIFEALVTQLQSRASRPASSAS